MNPGEPNPQQPWGQPGTQSNPAQPSAQPEPTQQIYGATPGAPTGGWQGVAPGGGIPGSGPQGPGYPAPPTSGWAGPSPVGPLPASRGFDVRAQLPAILLGASTVAGLVTYCMGFVSWVTPDTSVTDRELERWGRGYETGSSGIPGFASYEIVLNPGKFLIVLGAIAVAAALIIVPRFRKAAPVLAVAATASWLALFSAAITISAVPVISMGAGAIVALIFGFLQCALLVGAAVLGGLSKR